MISFDYTSFDGIPFIVLEVPLSMHLWPKISSNTVYAAFSPEDSMGAMFFFTAQENNVHRTVTIILQPDACFSLLFFSALRFLSTRSISVSSWSNFFSHLIFASSAAAHSLRVASTGSLYPNELSTPRET